MLIVEQKRRLARAAGMILAFVLHLAAISQAVEAQARSLVPAPELALQLPARKTLPGISPPGQRPTAVDRQRGIIRKVLSGTDPAPAPEPSFPLARQAPGAVSRVEPQPVSGEARLGYKILVTEEVSTRAIIDEPPGLGIRKIIVPERGETRQILKIVDAERVATGEPIDSRVVVEQNDLRNLPFSAIGQVVVQFRSGEATGTGFLIGPATVVTAGHVLIHPRLGHALRAEFTPGCRADGLPLKPGTVKSQAVSADRVRVSEAWARGDTALASDYGALLLPDAIGFQDCGAFLLEPVSGDFFQRHARRGTSNFMVAGFPEDKPRGTQWYGSGALLASSLTSIAHVIDTMPGQSGGPVFAIVKGAAGAKTVMAFGIHSRPAEFARNHNEACRIDARVLQDLKRWAVERPPVQR